MGSQTKIGPMSGLFLTLMLVAGLHYNEAMLSLMHFFYGLLAVGIGTLTLKYNYQLVNLTGRQDWIESKLGSGSTYLAYKLLALLIVIFGILYAIGLDGPVLKALFSPLQGLFPQK